MSTVALHDRFAPPGPERPLDRKPTRDGLTADLSVTQRMPIDLSARLPLRTATAAERLGELTMRAAGAWMVRPLARPVAQASRYAGPLAALVAFTTVVVVVLALLGLRAL